MWISASEGEGTVRSYIEPGPGMSSRAVTLPDDIAHVYNAGAEKRPAAVRRGTVRGLSANLYGTAATDDEKGLALIGSVCYTRTNKPLAFNK